MLFNIALKKKRNSTTGRSMVEMIAVLGIMGILSLGALSGINYVKDKNQAGQILKEALTQASEIQTTRRIKTKPNTSLEIIYPYEKTSEYIKSWAFVDDNKETIVLRAFNVSGGVCRKIVSSDPVEIFNCITVGENTTTCENISPQNCDAISNAIAFIADAKVTVPTGTGGGQINPCANVDCKTAQTGKVCSGGICICPVGTAENEDGVCVDCAPPKRSCNANDSWDTKGCQIWEHLDCSPDDCDQSTGKCCDPGETYYKEIEACCLSDLWAWKDKTCCNATVTASGLCCENETQSEGCCKGLNDDTAKYADGVCCKNGQIPSKGHCCPDGQEWVNGVNKCMERCITGNGFTGNRADDYTCECETGKHNSNGICCPYSQVNHNGVCSCENPNNNCGSSCCNGVGEKCYDAEKGICCTKELCNGVCCPSNAKCVNGACEDVCEDGEHIVDYYTSLGVKSQTCCPENLIGADSSGNCCPEGQVGTFGHNHYWQYISKCCPKEGQENKAMIGLTGLAETYNCAPPGTTMDASAKPGEAVGHTWYVPTGSQNVYTTGRACGPEETRSGRLHSSCGLAGFYCTHGALKTVRSGACGTCLGKWEKDAAGNEICILPDCTLPRQHVAYCYCNPANGSYYGPKCGGAGGTCSSSYPLDICITP